MALWGGRFSVGPDEALRKLNDSIGFDVRLYRQDIVGSVAYARALVTAGLLTESEASTIIDGLNQVRAEMASGGFDFAESDEDIHTAVERRLTELVGPLGGKLHTGRSRNDQVATDFRLWVLDAIEQLDAAVEALQSVLMDRAEQHTHTIMPGFTHMQPAQPIVAAHWLMSYFWMLARDRERLRDTASRTAVLPLGSGALSGTPYAVDREVLAAELGFNAVSENSLDAVSDRDFAAELLFTASIIGSHLSRLAEDVILYSSPAFGFIGLDDRYSTGSSLMPQKRNADPMELARGKAGRLIGNLTGFLTTLKGLPAGYNKDLQEDKEPVFDTVDTLLHLLPVVSAIIETLAIDTDRARSLLDDGLLATELADYLVMRGMPFREAHHVVGRVVRYSVENKIGLRELSPEVLKAISGEFDADALDWLDFDRAVHRRMARGGTAPGAVEEQIRRGAQWLAEFSAVSTG
ncbi:MAG: argininosuccinate lyase [Chloroflexota bacterium]